MSKVVFSCSAHWSFLSLASFLLKQMLLLKRKAINLIFLLFRASLGTIFCLPWVITWFGHEVREYGTLLKIYDYLIASPPLAPIYLSAAFVSYMEDELLEEECDMAMLHHKLSKVRYPTA